MDMLAPQRSQLAFRQAAVRLLLGEPVSKVVQRIR